MRNRPTCQAGVAALALAGLLAGCGTRLDGQELQEARGEGRAVAAAAPVLQDSVVGDGVAPVPPGTAGAPVAPASDGAAAAPGEQVDTEAPSQALPVPGTGTSPVPSAREPEGAPTAGSSPAAVAGQRPPGSTLVLGSVGTFSGPSGAAWKPGTDGLKVWAAEVNARGGVDGHPVKVITVDDGGDPARHLAAVKDLVEDKGVFAFVYNIPSASGSDATDAYLTQKGVPVVGGDLTYKTWDKHPMYFPHGTPQDDQILAHVTGAAKLRPGKKRFGSLTCREAEGCTAARAQYPAAARKAGLTPVFNAEVSIAQPDFTSECLAARNAGVELLAVVVDPNSARRVVTSCSRQDYKPTFVFVATVVSSAQEGDPAVNGTLGIISGSPYPAAGTPGQAAFRAAVAKYAPELELNVATPLGYAAGVMFETAARKGLGATPSRQQLIDNIYTFRGETLGGLAPPLTFVKGRKKSVPCFFAMEYSDQKWAAANGGKPLCP